MYRKFCLYTLAFLYFLFSSCSTARRADRHIARAIVLSDPEYVISKVVQQYCRGCLDTYKVTVTDTIFIKGVVRDTVVETRDTIVYRDSLIYIRIVGGKDSTHIRYILKSDTILRKVEVPAYKVRVVRSDGFRYCNLWFYLLLFIMIVILGYVIFKRYEHRCNK